MKRSDNYDYIKYYFEDRFDQLNEKYYKKINDLLSERNTKLAEVLNNLYGDNEVKFNSIHDLILICDYETEYLYKLIEKYGYNFIYTLLWGIHDICDTNYPKTEEYIINMLLKSPYIYSINKYSDYYIIDCILGKIPFKKASTYFSDLNLLKLKNYVIENDLSGLCHINSKQVLNFVKESISYTGLCKRAFTGTFYHSIAVHGKNCIDLNYKAVFPIDIYMRLTQFETIITVVQKRIDHFSSDNILLDLALKHQAEDKEIQKKLKLTFNN